MRDRFLNGKVRGKKGDELGVPGGNPGNCPRTVGGTVFCHFFLISRIIS